MRFDRRGRVWRSSLKIEFEDRWHRSFLFLYRASVYKRVQLSVNRCITRVLVSQINLWGRYMVWLEEDRFGLFVISDECHEIASCFHWLDFLSTQEGFVFCVNKVMHVIFDLTVFFSKTRFEVYIIVNHNLYRLATFGSRYL